MSELYRIPLGPTPDLWETDQPTDAGATFDPSRVYRYTLWRRWGLGPTVNFIMLNPSTADEHVLDPTIRRCMGFAKSWGMDAMVITNLFALRATDPDDIRKHPRPGGNLTEARENDVAIWEAAITSSLVVVAWGTHGTYQGRDQTVLDLLATTVPAQPPALHALRVTKHGHPSHPLYLPANLLPVPYSGHGDAW